MTSRERVIAAIKFEGPDRIPVDLWSVPASFKRHGKNQEELLEKYPIDFVHPNWPAKWDPDNMEPTFRLGRYTDEWGVVWENKNEGYSGMDVGHPLEDWRKLKDFRPPAHEWLTISYDDSFRDPNKFSLGVGSVLFHRMCFLRGMENLLVDLIDDVPEVHQLRDMLLDYSVRQLSSLARTAVDGIIFFEDWGSQNQLLIPPSLWRSFFQPVYRELFAICKQAGKFIFFHSDGYILEILEDLIELGIDALNSQVWCMGGPEVLGERFRGRITFWGEISRQTTMPHGTPDDIHAAAARMKKYLATPAGGLIGQGEVDDLTPLENIEALLTVWN